MPLTMRCLPRNARSHGDQTIFRDADGNDFYVTTSDLNDESLAIFGDPRELASFRRGMADFTDGRFFDAEL